MKKFFYSNIITIESIHIELSQLDLSEKERSHLVSLVESIVHHSLLDAVLSELSDDDKKIFLQHVSESEDKKIWGFLKEKVVNAEEKIKNTAHQLISELKKDIKEFKEKK